MTTEIDKETAKELIDDCDFGFIMIGNVSQMPSIGEVPIEDQKVQILTDVYSVRDYELRLEDVDD